jgi:hypothetical protein
MRNNALRELALIKIIVARFVGTGSFLIRYSNGKGKGKGKGHPATGRGGPRGSG